MSFTEIDNTWKMSSTSTHVYFVGGPFSQWHRSRFHAALPGDERHGVLRFNCAEQYMMAGKAALFGDEDAFARIMAADTPARQKALGREVRGFTPDVWATHARAIVLEGSLAKFSQNVELLMILLATGSKMLVEGAHYDPVWGVALAWDDPAILDPANWRGANWLGQCLMQARAQLYADVVARLKKA